MATRQQTVAQALADLQARIAVLEVRLARLEAPKKLVKTKQPLTRP